MSKISELPSATQLGASDLVPIVQNGTTKNIASIIMFGAVSVKMFGAKGDGVTDDSAAVAAALAVSNTIFFPPGTTNIYIVKDVAVGTNKTIYGCGSVFKPAPGSSSLFTLTGFRPAVHDCYFDCGNGNLTNSLLFTAATVVMDAVYPTTGNSQYVNCDTGLLVKVSTITTSSQTSKGSFYNLRFDTFTARGVLIGPNVNTCSFHDIKCYSGVVTPDNIPKAGAIGFQIYSTGSLGTHGGHMISNVDCEQSEYGFQLTDATLSQFSNCFADSVSNIGFQVTGTSTDIKFDNCFAGTCLVGYEISDNSSVIIDGGTTRLNGVVPPWWTGPAAFYATGTSFDIAVRNNASVQFGSWFGDHKLYADNTATLHFDSMDYLYCTSTATLSSGSVSYGSSAGIIATEQFWIAPRAGVLTNLTAQSSIAVSSANPHTYTVRLDGVNTSMVASFSDLATSGASSVPVTFNAGQRISIKVATSVGPIAVHRAVVSLRYF